MVAVKLFLLKKSLIIIHNNNNNMSTVYPPYNVCHPGEILFDELEARNMSQSDFAEIVDRPLKTINEIIKGKKTITAETANAIAAVLGTSSEMWLGLQSEYDLFISKQKQGKRHDDVKIRAELYSLFPVRELVKRNWIKKNSDVDLLKKELFSLFSISNISEWQEECLVNFKKSDYGETNDSYINSWIELGKKIARDVGCSSYNKKKLEAFAEKAKYFSVDKDGIERIVDELRGIGVRLVFLPHFSKTRVDGASLWVNNKPIILMSLRYDRIDNFYFTLLHEIGHILLHQDNDVNCFYDDLSEVNKSTNRVEKEANEFAQKFLVPNELISYFKNFKTVKAKSVKEKSDEINIHPGIIIGNLQYHNILSYNQLRKGLSKVKDSIPQRLINK